MGPSLLPQRPLRLRNNIDRYGFSNVLARYLGQTRAPRAFAEWMHGWCWWDEDLQVHDLGSPDEFKHLPLVVASNSQAEKAKTFGIENIRVGGLPICYVKAVESRRDPDSLVAFIEHTTEAEKYSIQDLRFLDYLSDIRHNFSSVCVSVYALDKNEIFSRELTRRGLGELLGADPFDANSMFRSRQIFEDFGHVTGNCMGSFIAYAFLYGANVSLFSPMFQRDYTSVSTSPHNKHPSRAEHLEYTSSEFYARRKFGDLFGIPGIITNANRERGEQYVGYANILPMKELRNILGWTPKIQIESYIQAASRRLIRISKKI